MTSRRPVLTVDRDWHAAALRIGFDRPEKRNALVRDDVIQLRGLLDEAERDPTIRCVVLHGSREAFCAGADLTELRTAPPSAVSAGIDTWRQLGLQIRTTPTPVLAVVEGPALGGGFHLSMLADVVLATPEAWFRHTGVDVGIVPMMPTTLVLAAYVGQRAATQMVLRPRRIDAADAKAMGLCTDVVPGEEVWAVAREWVDELSERDPLVVTMAKAELNVLLLPALGAANLVSIAGFLHTRGAEG